MTPDQAATVSAEMAAQRAAELASDARSYRLRKACEARAVELFKLLEQDPAITQILTEIDDAAK